MTEKIVLDPDSGIAPYEQLRLQLSELARSGALPVGHRLPTVRGFAEELGLAANTVAKAYRALEADGVIETRGRNGSFIAAAGGAAEQKAAAAAQSYAEAAQRLGLSGTGHSRSPRTRYGRRTRAEGVGPASAYAR